MQRDYSDSWEDNRQHWDRIYDLVSSECYKALSSHFPLTRKLAVELGCGDGENTKRIASDFHKVVSVDISAGFIEQARQAVKDDKRVKFVHSSVDEFIGSSTIFPELRGKVDVVFAMHILEHLPNPVSVLRSCAELLNATGVIAISVPNAESLHRQLGVAMGLIADTHALGPQDRYLGHYHVFDEDSLSSCIYSAGLTRGRLLGSFIKPLDARQLNGWSDATLYGLCRLGKTLPTLAADLCTVAWIPSGSRRGSCAS